MSKSLWGIIVVLLVFMSVPFVTLGKQAKVSKKANRTDISFEDLLVQGKYHFSDEAVVTVENDKVLDALLGVRKDFKDRIRRSASRY